MEKEKVAHSNMVIQPRSHGAHMSEDASYAQWAQYDSKTRLFLFPVSCSIVKHARSCWVNLFKMFIEGNRSWSDPRLNELQ